MTIIAGLEERATNAGFLNMFRNLITEAKLQSGESILEVGPGTGTHSRWLVNQTCRENPITGVDINNYLVGEATKLAKKAGLADVINFRKGNGESLPFADNTFDFTFSVTALEEGDANKMIAEMVRVTKPEGKVGAIVRALDIPFVINLPLRPDLKKKAEGFPNGAVRLSIFSFAEAHLPKKMKCSDKFQANFFSRRYIYERCNSCLPLHRP